MTLGPDFRNHAALTLLAAHIKTADAVIKVLVQREDELNRMREVNATLLNALAGVAQVDGVYALGGEYDKRWDRARTAIANATGIAE